MDLNKDKDEEPEFTELQAQISDSKWGWIALIVVVLCITGYQLAELFLTGN